MKKMKTMKLNGLGFYKPNLKWNLITFLLLFTVINVQANVNENTSNFEEIIQDHTITGTITDNNGQPLPGANIIEKGTTTGAQTDFDGNFSLTVSDQNATLVVSYLGFVTKEVAVNGQTTLSISLEGDVAQLDEVVVVGYGTQKRSDITGSVGSVKAKTIQELPIARADQALQGRIAGVDVQNNDAAPGGKTTIRIRGANSINGGNDPLIVIDGFQVGVQDFASTVALGNTLNLVHPNDVKSIEVLKDASATAIYGSKGANGVVLITTKGSKYENNTSISYSTYLSAHEVRKKLNLLNPAQYAETVNDNRTELGGTDVFSDSDIAGFRSGVGTDWQDAIFKTGYTQNHHLGISGGADNVAFYVSAELADQKGIVIGSSYKRYSIRPNVKIKVNDKIDVGVRAFLSKEADNPTIQNSFGGSPIYSAQVFAPTKPIFDANGNYSLPGGGFGPTINLNPVGQAVEPTLENFTNTTSINGDVNYEIIEGLSVNVMGGYRLIDYENNSFTNAKVNQTPGTEKASIINARFMTLQNTNTITYNKDFGDHNLKLTGVLEQQFEEFNESSAGATGSLINTGTFNNLGLGTTFSTPTSIRQTRSLLSYMGRVNYGYKSKYLLTLTARSDGSSVFGANSKRAFFPSAAIGWNISKESFLEDNETLTNLKLRASWGQVGNQAIPPFESLPKLNAGGTARFIIDGTSLSTGVNISPQAANPDLKWETTTQLNIGLDAHFFNGRIQATFDYYNKTTEDLLQLANLPNTSGSTTVLRNIGEVENKGFEIYLGAKPFNGEFTWDTGFTFTKNNNEVIDLGDESEFVIGDAGVPGFENSVWLQEGQPIGLFRGYQYAGVWKTSEATEAATFTDGVTAFFPGAPKFVDQNGDFKIDSQDIVNIGNAQADYSFGWNNSFGYKNFDLNIFIQGVQGNDIFNVARLRTDTTSGDSDATSSTILNRWSSTNENTNVPSFTGYNTFPIRNSSRWIEDGSYIRVKNISLGYKFSQKVLDAIGITGLRLYATGTNLITITDYTGYEPEASTNVDTFGGIDLAAFPSQKTYTLGLDVKF